MTLFNFDCFAVMSVEYDSENEPETPQCVGFWLSESAADRGIKDYETARIAALEKREEEDRRRWMIRGDMYTPPVFRYAIIPLRSLSLDLCDLDEALEAAAKLQMQGVGA